MVQGVDGQNAGGLSYVFDNEYPADSKVIFTIQQPTDGDCTTGTDALVEFSDVPSASVSTIWTFTSVTPPPASVQLASSSQACANAGIQDQVVVTLNNGERSEGEDDSKFKLALSSINYNVGDNVPEGFDVAVEIQPTPAEPTPASPSPNDLGLELPDPDAVEVNAVVTDHIFQRVELAPALPNTDGADLGTIAVASAPTNANEGLLFLADSQNAVTLTLDSGAEFTAGVKPTIEVPEGYTIYGESFVGGSPSQGIPSTDGDNTYTFWVDAPSEDALRRGAQLVIDGLKVDVDGDIDSVYVQTSLEYFGDGDGLADSFSKWRAAVNVGHWNARIGGANRYATAAKMFTARSNGGAQASFNNDDDDTVKDDSDGDAVAEAVLATGQAFPDALSANFLASVNDTGILLTKQGQLPQATAVALKQHEIERVYVIGGPAAISPSVVNQITSMGVGGEPDEPKITVVRLGGADRYATNKAVNSEGWHYAQPDVLLMATGKKFADALTLGPAGYASQLPLILTNGDEITAPVAAQLDSFDPEAVVIAGGPNVVSPAIADALRDRGITVQRLAGANRTLTSAKVATWATQGFDFDDDGTLEVNQGEVPAQTLSTLKAAVATGQTFPDALVGGPYAGVATMAGTPAAHPAEGGFRTGYPILLTTPFSQQTGAWGVGAYLGAHEVGTDWNVPDGGPIASDVLRDVKILEALGLSSAVSMQVMDEAAVSITPADRPDDPTP